VPMRRKLTIGKISNISIYQRSTGRWIVSWYDEQETRRTPSFATLKEAEASQKQSARNSTDTGKQGLISTINKCTAWHAI
jgi:hypothetical protein